MNVPTNAALLVRTLRFLDLDLQPDWPNVTVNTFRAGKYAQVAQKERIKCAEFILYKLFELWDPPVAKFKLRPYYPALEPRQSIKLRGVLFQLLGQLKTDGVLPRECSVRKSMLDDCVGEKFEELLFCFSSVVLRKVLDARCASLGAAFGYGMAPSLEERDMDLMQPLSLVLSKSLQNSLAERDERRRQFASLAQTLRSKESAMTTRQHNAADRLAFSTALLAQKHIDLPSFKQQLRSNYTCDPTWLELALSGDIEAGRDLQIESDFEKLWHPTITSTPLPPAIFTEGVLADLEALVQAQKTRLSRWQAFQGKASQRNEEIVVASSPAKSPWKTPARSPTKRAPTHQTGTPGQRSRGTAVAGTTTPSLTASRLKTG